MKVKFKKTYEKSCHNKSKYHIKGLKALKLKINHAVAGKYKHQTKRAESPTHY